jgi:hypothetical protein
MQDQSVKIEKVKNGWTVNHSWEEKNEKGETEFKVEEWVYLDKDEALNKVKELVNSV